MRTAQESSAADRNSDDAPDEEPVQENEEEEERLARLQARQLEEMRATENRLQEELRTEEVGEREGQGTGH